jgi:hypothetical protein
MAGSQVSLVLARPGHKPFFNPSIPLRPPCRLETLVPIRERQKGGHLCHPSSRAIKPLPITAVGLLVRLGTKMASPIGRTVWIETLVTYLLIWQSKLELFPGG